MEYQENKKNKGIGLTVTLVAHIIFLILAIFFVACNRDAPPYVHEDIGVPVSFGNTEFGNGDEFPDKLEEIVDEAVEKVEEQISEPIPDVASSETDAVDPNSDMFIDKKVDPKPKVDKKIVENKPKEITKPKEDVSEMKSRNNGRGDDKEKGIIGKENGMKNPKLRKFSEEKPGGGNGMNISGLKGWEVPQPDFSGISPGTAEITFEVDEDGEISRVNFVNGSFNADEKDKIKKLIQNLVLVNNPSTGSVSGPQIASAKLNILRK